MTVNPIHLTARSGPHFTGGRSYPFFPGGFEGATFLESIDDSGIGRRFCERPRLGVRNEYPLADLWLTFEKPEGWQERVPSETEWVTGEIKRVGAARSLIIMPWGDGWRWTQALIKAGLLPIERITQPKAYNGLLARGNGILEPGVYLTSQARFFLGDSEALLPAFDGVFDCVYVSKKEKKI